VHEVIDLAGNHSKSESKSKPQKRKAPKKSMVDLVVTERIGLRERIKQKRVERLQNKLSKISSIP